MTKNNFRTYLFTPIPMEHNTSPLDLEDVLLTIFRHTIIDCPSAVRSILFVNKKWNKSIRSWRVWHPHPLAIPALNQINDSLSYAELHYYIVPLLEAEIEAQIAHSLQIQSRLRERKKKRILNPIPDINAWRQPFSDEVNNNITGLPAESRQFLQLYFGTDHRKYCYDNYITIKQCAVLLAIASFVTTTSVEVMEAWPGVVHLFKSRDQLAQEASRAAGPIQIDSLSGQITKSGLRVPRVGQKQWTKFGDMTKRLYENNFVLSSIETASRTSFTDNYHLMHFYSWLTFLSPTRWLAMFYMHDSHEHDSYSKMICVKGDNSTGKSEVFTIKDRFDLDPMTGQKGDNAFKALYEISDEEWQREYPDPNSYTHNTLLQMLSGASWDIFEMLR